MITAIVCACMCVVSACVKNRMNETFFQESKFKMVKTCVCACVCAYLCVCERAGVSMCIVETTLMSNVSYPNICLFYTLLYKSTYKCEIPIKRSQSQCILF